MNLHSIVSGAIGTVNPFRTCTLMRSVGYTETPDGTQVPRYEAFGPLTGQVQPITSSDIKRLAGLNIQGNFKAIYLSGNWDAINRPEVKGGDLVQFGDGTTWLVTVNAEDWPDWTKVIVTQQLMQ